MAKRRRSSRRVKEPKPSKLFNVSLLAPILVIIIALLAIGLGMNKMSITGNIGGTIIICSYPSSGSSATTTNDDLIMSFSNPSAPNPSSCTNQYGYQCDNNQVRNSTSPITSANWDSATDAGYTSSCSASKTISGLSSKTNYYYAWKTSWKICNDAQCEMYDSGTSWVSGGSTAYMTGGLPDAPTSPAATAGGGKVDLSWTAPAYTGGVALTGYNIYWGLASPPNGAVIHSGTGTTYSHDDWPGGVGGVKYYYRISAVNQYGESANTSVVSATPTPSVVAPSAPVLTATAGTNKVDLSWTVADNGGDELTGYNIYWRNSTTSAVEGLAGPPPIDQSFLHTGLTAGTEYFYKVDVRNGVAWGPNSTEKSATPTAPVSIAVPPSAPLSLAGSAGDSKVTLTWSVPTSDGGAAITVYKIYKGTSSGGLSYLTNVTSSTSVTSYAATGLVNGVTYYFQVSAVNSAGEGAKTSEISASPVAASQLPECPYACCNAGTYQAKSCASDKICTDNACVTPSTNPCPYECCDSGAYLAKACPNGETCTDNACVGATGGTGVTEADAQVAISAAQFAIAQAEADNRDTAEAGALLSEAQDSFADKDYPTAKAKAVAAKTTAEQAELKKGAEPTPILWVSIITVIIIVAAAGTFVLWKQGKLDFLKKGKPGKGEKEPEEKEEESPDEKNE